MKITAVYNRAGKIVAAAVVSDERGGPIPVASKGVKSGVFEVPEALRDLELHTLCSSHRIDTRKRGLVTMKQSSTEATKKRKSR